MLYLLTTARESDRLLFGLFVFALAMLMACVFALAAGVTGTRSEGARCARAAGPLRGCASPPRQSGRRSRHDAMPAVVPVFRVVSLQPAWTGPSRREPARRHRQRIRRARSWSQSRRRRLRPHRPRPTLTRPRRPNRLLPPRPNRHLRLRQNRHPHPHHHLRLLHHLHRTLLPRPRPNPAVKSSSKRPSTLASAAGTCSR